MAAVGKPVKNKALRTHEEFLRVIDRAFDEATREAIAAHHQAGRSVPVSPLPKSAIRNQQFPGPRNATSGRGFVGLRVLFAVSAELPVESGR